ncbi:DUF5993 family protein [Symbiopectobacterium purcellii]|uniref:DUF5993 family protein n=1 Tax=Symbiopectobacterium purcellii TaxID=2871826 RepID=UPI003F82C9EE
MFFLFINALGIAISAIKGKKRLGYALWILLLIVVSLLLNHHITNPLNLSF